MQSNLRKEKFDSRHIGPDANDVEEMLKAIGVESLDKLIDQTVPADIRMTKKMNLDTPVSEYRFIENLKKLASKNKVLRSYIGLGYYPTITPEVIKRNILENPGWYTAYTPYQAEISQGRLEALINYQTMVMELTGMDIANASLLDEGTAAAEAMLMFNELKKRDRKEGNTFLISGGCFPQTIAVVETRAKYLGIEVRVVEDDKMELTDDVFGILVQYPAADGSVKDYTSLFAEAKEKGIYTCVAADLLSLTLLKPPGEFGADVVVGTTQRFGVPMGFGGPHAAYFATKDDYKRMIPGRIIGASLDADGNPGYRMALQTREQHIKREKATSNICTAQVLLAVIAGMYAVYHGAAGLKEIGLRIHKFAMLIDRNLQKLGYKQRNEFYFDTLSIDLSGEHADRRYKILELALDKGYNFVYSGNTIGISVNEVTDISEVKDIISIFAEASGNEGVKMDDMADSSLAIPNGLVRESKFLEHPIFNVYHSETEMLRYLKMLENKDLSLCHSMIPLGSCTMKLNAGTEMAGITWQEFSEMHPFIPADQRIGYLEIINKLEKDLCEITGFAAVSLQPNSGAQGEYAGMLVIRAYQDSIGQSQRNICLIPSSAHGTNPASAIMAGMKVVVVKCDENGNIDVDDLRQKAEQYKDTLAALMVTYPSTHGVFEESIKEVCKIIHDNGGQVYMDGANMNAQVGLTSPALIGADVCHLNLHKTFCIPHGGGGPGVGPIGVASHLVPFLPGHPLAEIGTEQSIGPVSAAPWGSASILIISYAYIMLMGAEGLTDATKVAILNANYMKSRLENYFKALYTGKNDRVAHELIFDAREFKHTAKVEVEDIAKRLMDYGFHAPTVSFPVPGTVMVEPTESESKAEIDRYCDALIAIREEIREIEQGTYPQDNNVLKNAPHTSKSIAVDNWDHPYSREKAVFPTEHTKFSKFWPSVRRIDSAYGDRNLVCSCIDINEYAEEDVKEEPVN
ncbi:MAG: aminomethyl-transferring glycine dehydrogenase [Ignavibacteriae bacterium]|nr:aminomethyl-transferring glycine dehydrogenase [Ignavibacteriota bacterium]MCB9243245.1 aminomethyl-transferring glycine dehydrogenase [Ignavibacteriales bacterium]